MQKHESKIPLRHRTADSILRLMGGKMETISDSPIMLKPKKHLRMKSVI
jgi:hypothetical protein